MTPAPLTTDPRAVCPAHGPLVLLDDVEGLRVYSCPACILEGRPLPPVERRTVED